MAEGSGGHGTERPILAGRGAGETRFAGWREGRSGWISRTTRGREYPSRVGCTFEGKAGQVVLDQIRTVDKARLVRKLGTVAEPVQPRVLSTLAERFAP